MASRGESSRGGNEVSFARRLGLVGGNSGRQGAERDAELPDHYDIWILKARFHPDFTLSGEDLP